MAVAIAFLLLAVLNRSARGWCLLITVACLMEVWPTFLRKEKYLRKRRTLIRWDGHWVSVFLPLARLLKYDEGWILSFCAWNNQRVREAFIIRPAEKALVLLPHCMQIVKCKLDLLANPFHCVACGRCSVGECLEAVEASSSHVRVSNRSHKAYLEVSAFQPDLVIGISCYTRLFKGLVKMPEVPSYVIPLQPSHGMCVDTQFNAAHLRSVLAELVRPGAAATDNVVKLKSHLA